MGMNRQGMADAPRQLFASTPAQRVAQARHQFFEEGVRPSGLVGEAVIQSWMRCCRSQADTRRPVALDAVSPSRLQAVLGRNHALLDAAHRELADMEGALAGTECRVLLTDRDGILLHSTHHPTAAAQPVLRQTARSGVNFGEQAVGTNAPGIVVATGQACTVSGAEHFFDALSEMQCAAAPIRDVEGRLAGVLDLSAEGRRFGFDAAAMVGLYATLIENRLLQSQSRDHLILCFQASPALLGTPLEALVGIASDGTIAWLNGAATRLLGRLPGEADERGVEALLGHDLSSLLRLDRCKSAQPLRLASGLGVWMQARLATRDGADFRHGIGMPPAPTAHAAQPAAVESAPPAPTGVQPAPTTRAATLRDHSRKLIEEVLAAHAGNMAGAARQLGVSRGTLYRRLRAWGAPASSGGATCSS